MKYLMLISHGSLANGLKNTLEMFIDCEHSNDVIALGLENGQSVDAFKSSLRNALAHIGDDDSLVILADTVGGSPLTATCSILEEIGKLQTSIIFTGMNLQMAITSFYGKDEMGREELIAEILSESKEAIEEFNIDVEDNDDDEDI